MGRLFVPFFPRAARMCLTAALVVAPQHALAWGTTGHATVAQIAELELKPAVWAELRTLLAVDGAAHLSGIASWADHHRRPGGPVHSTRIPVDGSPPRAHACPQSAGLCADEAIDHYGTMLADRSLPLAEREVALKYIVHLVGDLHQPLHGSDPVGYNRVTLDGRRTGIHAVWDNDIIAHHGAGYATLARELIDDGRQWPLGGTPRGWARESSELARDHIYDALPVCFSYKRPRCATTYTALPRDYLAAKWPLVAQRLKQAGFRLADRLNTLLG